MPCSVASAGARVASGLLWQAAQAFSYTALPGCSPAASAAAVECDQVSISAAIPNAAFHIVATAHIYCFPLHAAIRVWRRGTRSQDLLATACCRVFGSRGWAYLL